MANRNERYLRVKSELNAKEVELSGLKRQCDSLIRSNASLQIQADQELLLRAEFGHSLNQLTTAVRSHALLNAMTSAVPNSSTAHGKSDDKSAGPSAASNGKCTSRKRSNADNGTNRAKHGSGDNSAKKGTARSNPGTEADTVKSTARKGSSTDHEAGESKHDAAGVNSKNEQNELSQPLWNLKPLIRELKSAVRAELQYALEFSKVNEMHRQMASVSRELADTEVRETRAASAASSVHTPSSVASNLEGGLGNRVPSIEPSKASVTDQTTTGARTPQQTPRCVRKLECSLGNQVLGEEPCQASVFPQTATLDVIEASTSRQTQSCVGNLEISLGKQVPGRERCPSPVCDLDLTVRTIPTNHSSENELPLGNLLYDKMQELMEQVRRDQAQLLDTFTDVMRDILRKVDMLCLNKTRAVPDLRQPENIHYHYYGAMAPIHAPHDLLTPCHVARESTPQRSCGQRNYSPPTRKATGPSRPAPAPASGSAFAAPDPAACLDAAASLAALAALVTAAAVPASCPALAPAAAPTSGSTAAGAGPAPVPSAAAVAAATTTDSPAREDQLGAHRLNERLNFD